MTLLRTISVSPLPSYASRPDGMPTIQRAPSFPEVFGEVWRWLIGRPRRSLSTDRLRERRIVDEIAAKIEGNHLQGRYPEIPPLPVTTRRRMAF
jgi:hypothetical protein